MRRATDICAAFLNMRYISVGEAGSSIGVYDRSAKWRLSCSFCEELAPGSSPNTTTIPPGNSMWLSCTKVSAATFSPTLLKKTQERCPLMDAPKATSVATFSFTEN